MTLEILVPPCFQWFQLPAIPWAHARNMCFPLKQHGRLLCAWLLEGFILMACKKKMMLCSVSKLIQPSISTKMQATQYFNAFTCGIWLLQKNSCAGTGMFSCKETLEKVHMFMFCCEGNIFRHFLATTFFHLVTEKVSFASWYLPKKLILDPVHNVYVLQTSQLKVWVLYLTS